MQLTSGPPAAFARSGDGLLALRGDWTALGLGRAGVRLAEALGGGGASCVEVGRLGRFDTAGALALLAAGVRPDAPGLERRADALALMELAASTLPGIASPLARWGRPGLFGLLVRLGSGVADAGSEIVSLLAFAGRFLVTLLRLVRRPGRLRWAAVVALMERAGLDALPICLATSFFVGATLAFMGQDLLSQYGGQIFAVDMVGIGVLREFGLLVTAIILAGRSASSFAAEIGAMRMNQEVDAMRVMGVDPFEALVAPRVLALLLMTPLLVFASMVAGLLGGLVVVWATLGLSPAFFLQRILETVGPTQFYLGMVKAPVVAVIIAAIGCRQGLAVGGDVESLGRRVTAAVVQALFAIIMADAAFAFLFVEIGQ